MCPNCGYCPHCGRGGQQAFPWRVYPTWTVGPIPNTAGGNYLPPTTWTINVTGANPQAGTIPTWPTNANGAN